MLRQKTKCQGDLAPMIWIRKPRPRAQVNCDNVDWQMTTIIRQHAAPLRDLLARSTCTPGGETLYPELTPGKSGLSENSFALIDILRSLTSIDEGHTRHESQMLTPIVHSA